MKVILYMAVSADGFIATKDGDSDWVSEVDAQNFERKIAEAGCVILGGKTFDQYEGDLFPLEDVTNVVISRRQRTQSKYSNVVFVKSVEDALKSAKNKNRNTVLLIGGGTINGFFLNKGLIDEIFLSVHPLVLGDGIKLFEGSNLTVNLELLDSSELGEGLVQLHYKVIK